MHNLIPLSLYIHIPWCIKKCPYCDFNSYAIQAGIPEKEYIAMLTEDLTADLSLAQNRTIKSIFFGGGTPSLFSPLAVEKILNQVSHSLTLDPNIEVTLEANPGTHEHKAFSDYRLAGINRISLGAQSFQDDKLATLGRVHTADETKAAIDCIANANFNSYNLDLMYGLPNQTVEDALSDLETALSFSPPHLSWYNLTIEPNTIFHHQKPPLPPDETLEEMQLAGQSRLAAHGLLQYEVSAYAKTNHQCQHNLNYWQFGDYLGIGAGAHAKITDTEKNTITRYWKTRYPKNYLETDGPKIAGCKIIPTEELALEFMLNGLRLNEGARISHYEERTGLSISTILPILEKAKQQELLTFNQEIIVPTELGKRFLNDLTGLFFS